jgi:hypothetical protein
MPTGTDLQVATPAKFTIEASFQTFATGQHQTIVGRDGANVTSHDAQLAPLYFQIDSSNHPSLAFADVDGNWREITASVAVPTFEWRHMVGVSDGSTVSLYLNELDGAGYQIIASGSLGAGDTSLARADAGMSWSVGRGMYNGLGADRFRGLIDEVRITASALTPAEFLFAGPGCAGDVDGDGDTDLADLAALLAAYGSSTGGGSWNPNADLDGNGTINLADLAALLADYGC